MSGKVCVFGSFNCDMVARVERFPVPGESLVASGSMTSAGGKGANQATAALKAVPMSTISARLVKILLATSRAGISRQWDLMPSPYW
ncbi:Ribokinase [Raoultella planticola]|nr:Ribokinase [Raoultella planticola]